MINRKKIQMVAYFSYEQVIINSGRTREDDHRWIRGMEVPWDIVREFYNQLCEEATKQLGVRNPADNKVTFLFKCNGDYWACNFYDFKMTMVQWRADGWKGTIPENFYTLGRSGERVKEAIAKFEQTEKVINHPFTANLAAGLF